VEGPPTTVKTRVLVGHHQVARYDREWDEDVGPDDAEELRGWVERLAPDADAIVLEDYDKGVMVPAVIEAALDWGRPGPSRWWSTPRRGASSTTPAAPSSSPIWPSSPGPCAPRSTPDTPNGWTAPGSTWSVSTCW
jgi:hypothetical protein